MPKARLVAIAISAFVAVTAALLAAWWMSGRSRSTRADPPRGPAGAPGEVVIEIPSAAGPSSVAQVDGIAPLDPGKLPDAGTAVPAGVAKPHADGRRPR